MFSKFFKSNGNDNDTLDMLPVHIIEKEKNKKNKTLKYHLARNTSTFRVGSLFNRN